MGYLASSLWGRPASTTGQIHQSHPFALLMAAVFLFGVPVTEGRNNIRQTFMNTYPAAVGSALDHLPSRQNHCGVCHYDFSGGGTRNFYGEAISKIGGLNQETGRIAAIAALHNVDADGDGFTTNLEINAEGYANVPTFPGLTSANVHLVASIVRGEVEPHLTPTTVVDTTPPEVAVVWPNGGEVLTANEPVVIEWTASDASGIASIHIYESIDGGQRFTPVALGLSNNGQHVWTPANRPTTAALIRVVAVDGATNVNADVSNAAFAIVSPPGGRVATTLRDFDMPGTQPFEGGPEAAPPGSCGVCHGGYDDAVEPFFNWQGSMMALASIDPLFEANMAIANQDAPDSGDLCLRCHVPNAWLHGRSIPTDGSSILTHDKIGVSCDTCHRMVDPVYREGISPERDLMVLADLSNPGSEYGNGMYVIDPGAIQRGPFEDVIAGHPVIASPFHREAAFCGTCHDVSNPAFERDANGLYQPNALNAPANDFSPHSLAPVERTYSEWLHSAYNSPEGVYAPRFAGNRPDGRVASCQDCHMRAVAGYGADPLTNPETPLRQNVPLHDMTGGSTWMPAIIAGLYPDLVDARAVAAGIERARFMLQSAADLNAGQRGTDLNVRVTNRTGHKLPTGYPEGRRIWVNTRFFDQADNLVGESGAYDFETGVLTKDSHAKIYDVHPGIDENITALTGLPEGPSFHFVLNNKIFKDNRIPPKGFDNAAFAAFGGEPVGHTYADGQYWDDSRYRVPSGAVRAEVRLYYQSTSKEFVEFLRDQNTTNSKGLEMYQLWYDNDKCPPEIMAMASLDVLDPMADSDHDGLTNLEELAFGSDPHDPGSARHPELVEIEHAGETHYGVRYHRAADMDWGEITVEVSQDLINWNSGPEWMDLHAFTVLDDGSSLVVTRLTDAVGVLNPFFLRVRVHVP